ncbi:MAG: phospholipase, partial [Frankiales bacterium]|nr:phospholipase [Frankiales bacterium]
DHYFGAYPKGRGFDDHGAKDLGVFAQPFPNGSAGAPHDKLLPFRLTKALGEECTEDLTHDWGPQHQCWNNGKMDSFVRVHTSAAQEGDRGAMTMGYYTREELPFYWALADHFTLGDHYFSSILGPTHPNRLMSLTGTIDPTGAHGGPVTDTNISPGALWSTDWVTVQELLEDKGVSWKVYHPTNTSLDGKYADLAKYPVWADALYSPTANPEVLIATDHVLPYFKAFQSPASPLYQKAFLPTFPNDFVADVKAGTLPSVSWLIPPLGFDDHPSASPDHGQYYTSLVLDALLANPQVWAKTALVLMYDENDGWFDHVPPPVAPPGTPGEFLTAVTPATTNPQPNTLGFTGPLGLGVRVPMMVLSPFSRGGHVVSEVFDHTSQLRLLEERFGIHVPAISAWRRKTVGDLTSALFRSRPDFAMPALPVAPIGSYDVTGPCKEPVQSTEFGGATPVLPRQQTMPTQDGRLLPASQFFDTTVAPAKAPTSTKATQTSTTKSSYNRLAATGGLPDATAAVAVLAAAALVARELRGDPVEDDTMG